MSNTVINTNVLALNAHRSLKAVGTTQAKTAARLSSGMKINSAADDAAGLAISEKMRAQVRGLDMASKNSQDAISLIQTAEGGMQEIDNMLQRVRELTVQASNDTNEYNTTGSSDRQKMQDEVVQLVGEIDSMADRVEFNKKKVINGEFADPTETADMAATKLKGAAGEQTTAKAALDKANEALTGKSPAIGSKGALDNFQSALKTLEGTVTVIGSVDNIIYSSTESTTLKTKIGTASALSSSAIANMGTGGMDSAIKTQDLKSIDDVQALLKGVSVSIDTTVTSVTPAEASAAATFNAMSEKEKYGFLESYTGGHAGLTALKDVMAAGKALVDKRTALENSAYTAITTVKGADGTTAASFTSKADFDTQYADAIKAKTTDQKKVATSQQDYDAASAKVGRFSQMLEGANKLSASLGSKQPGLYFQVGANADQRLEVNIGSAKSDILGIGDGKGKTNIDLVKASGKQITDTLDALDDALTYVSSERSKLGASQNRLEYTIKSLDISSENLSAAESRIRDTDMAKEMMNSTKANVLQQAATAMLSQANQAPQNVLQLLR